MKSLRRGQDTSAAEVTNVSAHGFWILLAEEELFVPFAEFPWDGLNKPPQGGKI